MRPTPAVAARPIVTGSQLLSQRPLASFLVLTFAPSWLLWAPLVVLGDDGPAAMRFLLPLLGSLVPSVVGLAMTTVLEGRAAAAALGRRLIKLRVGVRWYLAALGLPALVPAAVGISILLGGDSPSVETSVPGALALFAFSIFPGSATGEELGWRGFALPRLQADRTALQASLLVGLGWGLWHLPLWLTGSASRPIALYPAFVVSAMAMSVILTWIYNGTGGSLAVVVVYHAAANLPITLLLAPLGRSVIQPFLIYTGLIVVAAAVIEHVASKGQKGRH